MTYTTSLKTQKIVLNSLIAVAVTVGLEMCAYILNLNQSVIFLEVALAVYVYLFLKIAFLYDLHFKNPGALTRARAKHENIDRRLHRFVRVFAAATTDRLAHMLRWNDLKHMLNYLLLPGLVFWLSICLLYLNFGDYRVQQIIIILSSLALIFLYWNLKEIFQSKKEKVDLDIFATLSVVKLYTAFLLFAACIGITKRFCLSSELLVLGVFALVFLLVYQALFQHNSLTLSNINSALVIALIMAVVSYQVLRLWGFNYFTAAIFLTAVYNFLWSTFHASLDKALTIKVFVEQLLIALLVIAMVLSATNFRAQVLDGCVY